MASTRKFSDTIKADLENNADFRRALLSEAVACMVSGDVETGKVVLREYVNGTVGFLKLGAALGRSPKSLMRMLGPAGNGGHRLRNDVRVPDGLAYRSLRSVKRKQPSVSLRSRPRPLLASG